MGHLCVNIYTHYIYIGFLYSDRGSQMTYLRNNMTLQHHGQTSMPCLIHFFANENMSTLGSLANLVRGGNKGELCG